MLPTTALCAIMRNEGPYILEWIAYHRSIGFDHIAIYDNESSDETAMLCRPLAAAGLITYVPRPDPPPGSPVGPQLPAYQHAAAHLQADWLCCLDADEFLVLETARTVRDFLATAGQAGMPIALNWRTFGSGGALQASSDLVISRFVRCGSLERGVNKHIKTLGPMSVLRNGAQVHIHGWPLGVGQHYVDAAGLPVSIEGSTWLAPPRWRGAWVNHYIVKSREEFEGKIARGAGVTPRDDREKDRRTFGSYFDPYDANEEENLTIQRFRAVTLDEMRVLGQAQQQEGDQGAGGVSSRRR